MATDPYAAFAKPVREAPTPKERKTEADIVSTETSTGRTATLTPLEAEEKRIRIAAAKRKEKEDAEAKAAAAEAKKASDQERRQKLLGFLEDIQRVKDLLSNPLATGPAAQLTGGLFASPGANLDALVTALKSPVVLQAMREAREGSKVGATGFGSLAVKEMDLLASAQGSLSTKQSPEELLRTLNRIDTNTRRFLAYTAGYDPNKPEGAALVGLALPKGSEKLAEPSGGDLKRGRWVKNPELAGVDAAVTSMIKAGRSEGQIRQWLNEYQEGLGDRTENLGVNIDYWRKTKKTPVVTVERQFVPSEGPTASLGTGAGGAFATGAAEQLTAGFLDELSGDREKAAAVQRGLREQNPGAYTAGSIAGGLLSVLAPEALAAKYGLRLPALLQGTPQAMLYGAGSAEPGERLSGALYEGLMAPFTNVAGNIVGKAVGVPLQGADEGIRRLAKRYGINLTPGQMTGGGGAEQTLSGLPIVGPQITQRRNETLEQFNRAAFDEGLAPIGAKVSAPGQQGIADAQEAVSKAYTDALGSVTLTPDQTFAQQVRGKPYSELGKLRDIGSELQKEVDDIFARHADPSGVISGENLQEALQDLQQLKTSYNKDPRWKRRIAPQIDEISDAYSGLLERQAPENFELFKKANEAYRNVSILERAVEKAPASTGGDIFNPSNLRSATKEGTTRFGGKKASARGDRPFNELVMPALNTVPAKFDDVSLTGRLASPSIGAGIGVGYGGVSMLSGQGEEKEEREPGVLPAPIAYGLLGAGLSSIPYTRAGTRAMSSLLTGERSPRQQTIGRLFEQYFPAVFRGVERGYSAEPGVPMPQEPAPLISPEMEKIINEANFAPVPPEKTEEIKVINGRPAKLDEATNQWLDVETGEPLEGFAYGGLVFAPRGY